MSQHDLAEQLGQLPLFESVGRLVLLALAQACELQTGEKGDVLVREDDLATRGFYLILEGSAKVVLTGPDGREAVLALLEEGDFFGEMSLLDGDPRSATVRATTEIRLVLLRRPSFMDLLQKHPEISIALLTALSSRLRQANRKISALALSPVHARVSSAILQLAEFQGFRVKGQVVIHDRPTQQEIAEMASTTRETVSRVLGQMQKDGLIQLDGRELVILDEVKLRGEQ
jgi:CRP/FNR family transcriptional regulator/CRP/FNR family cyclic AMP-dependent transcriptional regulator